MDRTKKILLWVGGSVLLLFAAFAFIALYAIRSLELEKNRARTAKANETRRQMHANGKASPEQEQEAKVTSDNLTPDNNEGN